MMVTASDLHMTDCATRPLAVRVSQAIVMNPWQFPAADATDERQPVGLLTSSPVSTERANE